MKGDVELQNAIDHLLLVVARLQPAEGQPKSARASRDGRRAQGQGVGRGQP